MLSRAIPLLILVLFRFYDLGARPIHHDESVNGWFVDGILNRGFYVYDPQNYHGPLFFYILTFFEKIFGRSVEALRYPTVFFGSLIVLTPFLFRKWIGTRAAWIAALFFTISPANIFYTRYSIHETLFALTCVLFFYFWCEVKESKWTTRNIWGVGLSLGTMACLKENFVLYVASLGIAETLLWVYEKKAPFEFNRAFWKGFAISVFIAMAFITVFFTGFFQDPPGIPNFFRAFLLWFETGEKGNGHAKPFYYWLTLMGTFEWFALLGLLLTPFALKKIPRQLRLVSVLGFGLWLLYSLIAYKTPWCVLSYEWCLILVASYWISRWLESNYAGLLIAGIMGGAGICLYQTYDVAYAHPDQDGHIFIYGQTYHDLLEPVDVILKRAEANPAFLGTATIQVISAFTWPFPYLFGKFPRTGYFGEGNAPQVLNGDYVIMDKNFEPKLIPRLQGNYTRQEVRSRQWALPVVFYTKNPG